MGGNSFSLALNFRKYERCRYAVFKCGSIVCMKTVFRFQFVIQNLYNGTGTAAVYCCLPEDLFNTSFRLTSMLPHS